MTQMTVSIISLVAVAIFGAVYVIMVARATERTHPELGDLPAVLLTIFLVAFIGCAIEKLLQLDVKRKDTSSSVTRGRGR